MTKRTIVLIDVRGNSLLSSVDEDARLVGPVREPEQRERQEEQRHEREQREVRDHRGQVGASVGEELGEDRPHGPGVSLC